VKSDVDVVRKLCEQWSRLTREGFAELLAPDCHYLNVPWPDQTRFGPDGAYRVLSRYQKGWKVELKILHIADHGEVVLTERLERFQRENEDTVHELYVMGAFEMKDGKIAKWRDYFDSVQAQPLLA